MLTPVLLGKVPEGTEARPGDPILPREWLPEKPHGSRTYLLLTPGITSSTVKMTIQEWTEGVILCLPNHWRWFCGHK